MVSSPTGSRHIHKGHPLSSWFNRCPEDMVRLRLLPSPQKIIVWKRLILGERLNYIEVWNYEYRLT